MHLWIPIASATKHESLMTNFTNVSFQLSWSLGFKTLVKQTQLSKPPSFPFEFPISWAEEMSARIKILQLGLYIDTTSFLVGTKFWKVSNVNLNVRYSSQKKKKMSDTHDNLFLIPYQDLFFFPSLYINYTEKFHCL